MSDSAPQEVPAEPQTPAELVNQVNILVTGDFASDYNIYLPDLDCSNRTCVPHSKYKCIPGGATIIYSLLKRVKRRLDLVKSDVAIDVGFCGNPNNNGKENLPTASPAAGLWQPHDGGKLLELKKKKIWRLKQDSLGLGDAKEFPLMAPLELADESVIPDILVVEDDGGKFRFRLKPAKWPKAITLSTKGDESPQWIIYKMTGPVCQGDLWWHLTREGLSEQGQNTAEVVPLEDKQNVELSQEELEEREALKKKGPYDRMIVVLPVDDLRHEDIRISRGISWERTAEDVVRAMSSNPLLEGLRKTRHVVVVLDGEGAVWYDRDAAPDTNYRFIFDPGAMEGEWSDKVDVKGTSYGFMSGFTAALTVGVCTAAVKQEGADEQGKPDVWEEPDIKSSIECGLNTVRRIRILGHGECDRDRPGIPYKKLAASLLCDLPKTSKTPVKDETLLGRVGIFGYSEISMPVGSGAEGSISHCADDPWRILKGTRASDNRPEYQPLYGVARRVALFGLNEMKNIPFAEFGKLLTTDRNEIEALRNIKSLIQEYKNDQSIQQPLSIGVFGPPGSGKSFAIKEIAAGILGEKNPCLTFNLSQFDDTTDLIGALHQVRDKVLEGHLPVVFWDEFDSGGYKWLQYLLAPMQDGKFQEDQITHPVGRCIFVFAGATSYDFENFGPNENKKSEEWTKFKLLKGPDFKSRLHGYLDVLGPNRRQTFTSGRSFYGKLIEKWEDDPNDVCFPVRRAIFLRGHLGLDGDDDDKRMDIDQGLLAALLEVQEYKHGSRSLVKIITALRQEDGLRARRSGLPSDKVLGMNTDPVEFMRIATESERFQEKAERLAPRIHEFYRTLSRRKGWDVPYDMEFDLLPENIKKDNVAGAYRIPWVLSLAGLYLKEEPTNPNETDWMPPIRDIIQDHLEILAREEHDLWMQFRMENGWKFGKVRDDQAKRHTCLVQFEKLPEADKQKDRDNVSNYPDIAKYAGFKIVTEKPKE